MVHIFYAAFWFLVSMGGVIWCNSYEVIPVLFGSSLFWYHFEKSKFTEKEQTNEKTKSMDR